jgi:hypothetical protein
MFMLAARSEAVRKSLAVCPLNPPPQVVCTIQWPAVSALYPHPFHIVFVLVQFAEGAEEDIWTEEGWGDGKMEKIA